jgi:hypothetical protein
MTNYLSNGDNMDQNEFLKQQQEAAERMRRMHERSQIRNTAHTAPPAPDFVRLSPYRNENHNTEHTKSQHQPDSTPHLQSNQMNINRGFDLATLMKDGDAALIIGLLLLLYSEKADTKLLLALLYILI